MADGKNRPEHWVLDKRLNIANLLGFFGVAIAAVVAFIELKGEVNLNRENIADNESQIILVEERQQSALISIEARQNSKFVEIKALLQRIEDKLDRKVDKN